MTEVRRLLVQAQDAFGRGDYLEAIRYSERIEGMLSVYPMAVVPKRVMARRTQPLSKSEAKRRKALLLAMGMIFATGGIITAIAALSIPSGTATYAIRVSLPGGCWEGQAGFDGGGSSYQGCGTQTITLQGRCGSSVGAVMQKGYDANGPYPGTMTVEIVLNGQVIKSGSTSADYGLVSVFSTC